MIDTEHGEFFEASCAFYISLFDPIAFAYQNISEEYRLRLIENTKRRIMSVWGMFGAESIANYYNPHNED
jgi:hypothetical protein